VVLMYAGEHVEADLHYAKTQHIWDTTDDVFGRLLIRNNRGMNAQFSGDLQTAQRWFLDAFALARSHPDEQVAWLFTQGSRVWDLLGDLTEAERLLGEAIVDATARDARGELSYAYSERGQLRFDSGDDAGACADLDRAIRITGLGSLNAVQTRAQLALVTGEPDARAWYQRLHSLASDRGDRYALAVAHTGQALCDLVDNNGDGEAHTAALDDRPGVAAAIDTRGSVRAPGGATRSDTVGAADHGDDFRPLACHRPDATHERLAESWDTDGRRRDRHARDHTHLASSRR